MEVSAFLGVSPISPWTQSTSEVLRIRRSRAMPLPGTLERSPGHSWNLHPALMSDFKSGWVTGIGVSKHSHPRIRGQHAGDSARGVDRSVGDDHLSSVEGVTHAHAASMMKGNPGGAIHGVDQGIENGPIGDRVGTIHHRLRFPIWRGNGTAVEVVAADHDRGLDRAPAHQLVEHQTGLFAFPVAAPPEPGGQSLELDALAG